MSLYPTEEEVIAIYGEAANPEYYLNGRTLVDDYIPNALRQVQTDLYVTHGRSWPSVYEGSTESGSYPDSITEQQVKQMLALKSLSMLFFDFAGTIQGENAFIAYSHEFRSQYESLLNRARLGAFTNVQQASQGGIRMTL
jgi:hypothetical protein